MDDKQDDKQTEQRPADTAVTPESEASQPLTPPPQVVTGSGRSSRKRLYVTLLVILLIGLAAGGYYVSRKAKPQPKAQPAKTAVVKPSVQGLRLDSRKNYGDKYANGLLPVGDGKHVTDTPKVGYVYACGQYAQNLSGGQGGGVGSRGPWFTNNNTQYDINKKAHVSGSVSWQASFTNTLSGDKRTLTSNGLPTHVTGIFPIQASDAAYAYDRNPNKISAQTLSYVLTANPAYGAPNCMGGESGIMLSGVPIFNGFDAGGRDAGAWEVQDGCSGHPEKTGGPTTPVVIAGLNGIIENHD